VKIKMGSGPYQIPGGKFNLEQATLQKDVAVNSLKVRWNVECEVFRPQKTKRKPPQEKASRGAFHKEKPPAGVEKAETYR